MITDSIEFVGLSKTYAQMAKLPFPKNNDPRFQYWHVEGLLSQAAQLLQRAVEERSEYFSVLAQQEIMLDQIARDANDATLTRNKSERGSRNGEMLAQENEKSILGGEISTKLNEHSRVSKQREYTNAADAQYAANGMMTTSARLREEGFRNEGTDFQRWHTEELNRQKTRVSQIDSQFFGNRLAALERRLVFDYECSLTRLSAASDGLCNIFGYDQKLADQIKVPANPKDGWNALDAMIDWLRAANEWLSALLENDQQFTNSFSLTRLIGAQKFKANVNAAKERLSFLDIPIDPTEFAHDLVRLRGISVYVTSSKRGTGVWHARVAVPKSAVIPVRGGLRPIDQGQMPTVSIGRISDRESPSGAEMAGSVSIGNASPIGNQSFWQLTLQSPTDLTTTFQDILDIELELHLSGQARS